MRTNVKINFCFDYLQKKLNDIEFYNTHQNESDKTKTHEENLEIERTIVNIELENPVQIDVAKSLRSHSSS